MRAFFAPRLLLGAANLGLSLAAIAASAPSVVSAQANYEIQVYGSETVPAGVTMFELHSNFTLDGRKFTLPDGEIPTNHALHETLEITHGWNDWSELGFYWFMSKPDGQNLEWVGTHLRPRFRAPESWGWPVGVSISQEIGYTKAEFTGDTWTYEFRPIIDKSMGPWYVAINPALEKSLRGPTASTPFVFSPNVDVGYDLTKKVNLAVEYYGETGPLNELDPIADQQHQIFGAVNLDWGPDWEFNLGYGTTLTAAGDKKLIKMILGRRVGHPNK
ncbi:MAG TPA: hypothetical protein VHV78_02785 [Gemmatimonadaceae bacterium]|jgi:hypothetical protein|nr:hypothetical protein [Gemmatimonadaceae bacterium]